MRSRRGVAVAVAVAVAFFVLFFASTGVAQQAGTGGGRLRVGARQARFSRAATSSSSPSLRRGTRQTARFYCNNEVLQARSGGNDFIVNLKPGYEVEEVVGSLGTYPENLQRFETLGNMFAATLSQGDVISLLRNEAVDYVECDAKVSIGRK
ncbi:hypothetical protein A3770_03p22690 [Chloropicon primus]|uniref:Uncharacterized protein n=1 Tax=Chloropicon primus TaxID=1764295 RepID=A0A5B8MHK1_9CHLO|nr:hypothetical protein A3770_03p22690 [Chloropicon primus]|eukprot:QDZ19751.1 hypothetical protein A3770_03p22690 [Chloropicon primus]